MLYLVFIIVLINTYFLFIAANDDTQTATTSAVSKTAGPPSFFIRDLNDGLCLAGDTFKRCSIDTLWYVTGKEALYQFHHRVVEGSEDDDDLCFGRLQCHDVDTSPSQLGSCEHCGSKGWNILGEADTGYVLTQDRNKYCVKRDNDKVKVVKCDAGYTAFTLQFVNNAELTIMNSESSKLTTAAAENDMNLVKSLLKTNIDVDSRDWDTQTPLMAASSKGHINMVKHLISAKADVNIVDKDNVTALMEASISGHKNVVDYLLNNGANVNAVSTTGFSSLWLASSEGHLDVVKILIKKGADPNNTRADGITTLIAAQSGGYVDIMKELVKAGAGINVENDGMSVLLSAIENGSFPIVKLLVDNKADINFISSQGFSPIIVASAHGKLDIIKYLVKNGALINMEHPENVSALMYAAAGGFPDVVQYLIDNNAVVNQKHKQGGTALLEAVPTGNVSCINILLAANADPLVTDNDGITTVISAASQGHAELVKLFASKGVDINKVTNSGGSALMFAASEGHNETAKLLIELNADVSIATKATPEYRAQVEEALSEKREGIEPHKDDVTALHVAALGGHMFVVELLVKAGANINAVDEDGMTPLLNAVKGNFANVAKYLVEHGANPNDIFIDEKGKSHNMLMDSIMVSNNEFSLLLIEKGANISYLDEDKVSIATQAAYLGQLEIIKQLISRNADIISSNTEGINPLIASSSEGHHEIVKELLATKKIDINAKDKDGTNALMAASVRGHKEVVSLLLQNGAEVNSQNVDGHTPLMFAYNGKNQVESLLDKYAEYLTDDNDNSTKIIKDALQTHIEVVQLLLDYKADPTMKDKEGHTALDFDFQPLTAIEGSISNDEL